MNINVHLEKDKITIKRPDDLRYPDEAWIAYTGMIKNMLGILNKGLGIHEWEMEIPRTENSDYPAPKNIHIPKPAPPALIERMENEKRNERSKAESFFGDGIGEMKKLDDELKKKSSAEVTEMKPSERLRLAENSMEMGAYAREVRRLMDALWERTRE